MSVERATRDWFDVGWDAYKEGGRYPESFPPRNDMEAQRAWLGGFGAAWVEASDEEAVDEALVRVVEGKEELLRQKGTGQDRAHIAPNAVSSGARACPGVQPSLKLSKKSPPSGHVVEREYMGVGGITAAAREPPPMKLDTS